MLNLFQVPQVNDCRLLLRPMTRDVGDDGDVGDWSTEHRDARGVLANPDTAKKTIVGPMRSSTLKGTL
jgi:hypothetical protein